jgi:hypothetical protein
MSTETTETRKDLCGCALCTIFRSLGMGEKTPEVKNDGRDEAAPKGETPLRIGGVLDALKDQARWLISPDAPILTPETIDAVMEDMTNAVEPFVLALRNQATRARLAIRLRRPAEAAT